MFDVVTYDRNYLEGMIRVFNSETVAEQHIAEMTPDLFIKLVEPKAAFDPTGVFIAVENGRVLGWVHACSAAATEPWQDQETNVPQIRMLMYPRERLEVGQQLVRQATEWLMQFNPNKLPAMHCQFGYPFYRGIWAGGEPMCPVTLPHLHLAFDVCGYKNDFESIFMVKQLTTAPVFEPAKVKLDFVDTPLKFNHTSGKDSWTGFDPQVMKAYAGGEYVGRIGWAILPYLATKLGAPAVNIWSLSTEDTHRRMGIGGALVSRVLEMGYQLGARTASVDTQLWNTPAHSTYAKFGYLPYLIVVGRTLTVAEK